MTQEEDRARSSEAIPELRSHFSGTKRRVNAWLMMAWHFACTSCGHNPTQTLAILLLPVIRLWGRPLGLPSSASVPKASAGVWLGR